MDMDGIFAVVEALETEDRRAQADRAMWAAIDEFWDLYKRVNAVSRIQDFIREKIAEERTIDV